MTQEAQKTLRDEFAMAAIGAIVRQCAGDAAFGSFYDGSDSLEQYFSRKSYAIADAMLAARAEPRT